MYVAWWATIILFAASAEAMELEDPMMLFLFFVLIACVIYGTAQVRILGLRLTDKLASLEELLAKEFTKEQEYYKERNRLEDRFQEMLKETHGLGPADAVPEPPEPPAIVLAAELLRSISRDLAYLRRLTEALEKMAAAKEAGQVARESK
jgi:hypothetical protein